MRYVKVENGVIGDIIDNPGWLNDQGQPLEDSVYIQRFGIYPLDEEHRGDDGYYVRPKDEWVISDTGVSVLYYTIIDERPDSVYLGISVDQISEDHWVVNISNNTIEVGYEERQRSDIEIDEIIENYETTTLMDGVDGYQQKPREEWLFDGGYITKTYYKVIPDDQRELHPVCLYDISTTDPSTWVVDGDEIYEKCVFTQKTDIIRMRIGMKDVIAHYRWLIEVGGVMMNEHKFATDRDSQLKVTAKYILAINGKTDDVIYWKTNDGFIGFTVDEFVGMALTVERFVSDVYNRERMLYIDIQECDTFEQLKSIYDNMESLFDVPDSAYILYGEDKVDG